MIIRRETAPVHTKLCSHNYRILFELLKIIIIIVNSPNTKVYLHPCNDIRRLVESGPTWSVKKNWLIKRYYECCVGVYQRDCKRWNISCVLTTAEAGLDRCAANFCVVIWGLSEMQWLLIICLFVLAGHRVDSGELILHFVPIFASFGLLVYDL